jgi:hypothetical protein
MMAVSFESMRGAEAKLGGVARTSAVRGLGVKG